MKKGRHLAFRFTLFLQHKKDHRKIDLVSISNIGAFFFYTFLQIFCKSIFRKWAYYNVCLSHVSCSHGTSDFEVVIFVGNSFCIIVIFFPNKMQIRTAFLRVHLIEPIFVFCSTFLSQANSQMICIMIKIPRATPHDDRSLVSRRNQP